MVFKIILFVILAVFLFLFIRNVVILYGFRKGNTKKTNGYLNEVKHEKNVYVGRKSGRFYKHWVSYTYTYHVNEKSYSVSGGSSGKPDNIQRTVRIIYQKKKPKYAYAENHTFPNQIVYAILFGILTLVSMVLAIPALIEI